MARYHPDARFLTDYAAASLPVEQALCVTSHLHYCTACRTKVGELTELGAELFQQQVPLPLTDARADEDFARLVARVATAPAAEVSTPPATALPRPLHKLTGGDIETLRWRRIGRSFRYSPLQVGKTSRETSLLHIRAGGSVPHHRHGGDEITVVLQGSFSDQDDKYGVGDFIVRTPGEQHSPVASQDADCLCLTTLDRPIVMTNLFYRLLAPLF